MGKKAEKVPVTKLFRTTKRAEVVSLVVGLIAAILHGAAAPFLAVIFGGMTDFILSPDEAGEQDDTAGGGGTIPGQLPDADGGGGQMSSMEGFSTAYAYLGVFVLVFTTIQALCWEVTCEKQIHRLRNKFLYQAMRQNVSWHEQEKTGDLVSQLSDDMERVREGMGHKFSFVFQYLSTIVFGFIVGMFASWKMTLVILAVTPVLAAATAVSAIVTASSATREQDRYGKAGDKAQQVLGSIRTVAAFGGEAKEIVKYKEDLDHALSEARKKYRWLSLAFASVYLFIYAAYALVVWYGAKLLADQELTPGNIFTVLLSSLTGAFAIGNMLPFVTTLGLAQGSATRPFKIIDTIPTVDPFSESGIKPEGISGKVEFKNVTFTYPSRPDVAVLNDFSLTVEPGERIAIVGASGAGKSTIVNLLLRFYEPDFGEVMIDGMNLSEINLHYLRESIIGVVTQEPVLFAMTIEENIALGGTSSTTFDQIVAAAKLAHAHDFISSLPQGYSTHVGDLGSQLSGGQRQRIVIARAIVENPKILLLDEATSALDVRSEKIVQKAFNSVTSQRTTIVIAHRLNTIRDVDKIYFLKSGVVVESGTHTELMSQRGLYYHHAISQELVEKTEKEERKRRGSSAEPPVSEEDAEETDVFLARSSTRRRSTSVFSKLSIVEESTPLLSSGKPKETEIKAPGTLDILKYMRQEWGVLALGLFGCVIVGAIAPIFSYMYGYMLKIFSLPKAALLAESKKWALMFLALAFLSAFGMWIRNYIGVSAERLALRLRVESYTAILRQSIGWYDDENHAPGVLLTRLSSDIGNVKGASSHRIAVFSSAFVTVTLSLIIAYFSGWELALVLSLAFPLIITASYLESKIVRRTASGDRFLKENAGKTAAEALMNIRTVQAIGKEQYFLDKYQAYLDEVLNTAKKEAVGYSVIIGFSESIMYFTYAAAFTLGAYLVNTGHMEFSQVYQVFFAITICAVSVGQLMSMKTDYSTGRESVKNVYAMIQSKSEIDSLSTLGVKPKIHGNIRFENVYFSYPQRPAVPVLRGLSLSVDAGKTLAVVGTSGGGKSTIVSLIERFYDPIAGRVLIDDWDIRKLNVGHLRESCGLVLQEPFLFDMTIAENISYGVPSHMSRSQTRIEEAAKLANAHDFIMELPDGYFTMCGQRGALLSGGQKQRIAIARAIIRDPKILLLDEATSALDPINEKIVQEALDKARLGRTCIIVAHRLSTVQTADSIAVIHGGRVAEQGTHSQLLAKKGVYYQFVEKQKEITDESRT